MKNTITIKEYAENRGKTVQSVYQQLNRKRLKKLLDGHIKEEIINNKNIKVLDEVAIKLLDEASNTSIQIIEENNKTREYEEATKEIDELKQENEKLKELLIKLQSEMVSIQNKLIDTQTLLIEQPKKVDELSNVLDMTNKENTRLKDELNSYEKTIFGLYRKVNK